jgi:TonB family protein
LQQAFPAPGREKTGQVKGGYAKWGYLAPASAAGILLLAILFGSKLLHPRPSAEPVPPSSAESSQQQTETKERTEAAQPAQITSEKNEAQHASNAPAPPVALPAGTGKIAAPTDVTKNATARNASSGRVQGAVVRQVLPDVSRSALGTIHGKLKVRIVVAVNSSGNVTLAKFGSRGPSKYFADRALQAARKWTFRPPQVNGQDVSSEWALKFEFGRTATDVHPAQTAP